MSKRTKYKRLNKQNDRYAISNTDKLMRDLDIALKSGTLNNQDRKEALEITILYVTKGRFYLTNAHKYKSLGIIKKYRAHKRTASDCKQYLYAISDGTNVKLGRSNNIKKRIIALQTSNSKKLVLLWEKYTGRNIQRAVLAEKKLHRKCKNYKIRGEWFNMQCMLLVANFKID
ncbi:MAG: GIY-YIG nuclease family protein [Colwellia sp.]|nr:GIY-YIG nuclease family protein [Colwellia sp.]